MSQFASSIGFPGGCILAGYWYPDLVFAPDCILAAYLARHCCRVYACLSTQGTGEAKVGAKMDGLLTRDLQLRPEAKFAFFLRPLPARAKHLSGQATLFRRRLLKVDTVPKARRRYCSVSSFCCFSQNSNYASFSFDFSHQSRDAAVSSFDSFSKSRHASLFGSFPESRHASVSSLYSLYNGRQASCYLVSFQMGIHALLLLTLRVLTCDSPVLKRSG